jgi:hypothetical protein
MDNTHNSIGVCLCVYVFSMATNGVDGDLLWFNKTFAFQSTSRQCGFLGFIFIAMKHP